jgi:hypothetical protein
MTGEKELISSTVGIFFATWQSEIG